MAGSYQLTLATPAGLPIARLAAFTLLDYTLAENDYAPLTLQYPASALDLDLLAVPDGRLYVERAAAPGLPYALEGQTAWFIRRLDRFDNADGVELVEAEAYSANYLLDAPIIAYNVGNAYTLKLDAADDMMKAIVRENMGTLATDTDRDLSDYLQVQGDGAGGPTLRKDFARRSVLRTLQEISDAAVELGTWVGFGVVVVDQQTGLLEFQTYIDRMGADHTQAGGDLLVVGKDFGNLANPRLSRDHTQERSYVYAGGQGVGDIRAVGAASDTARIAVSPFGRRELWVEAGNTFDADALTGEAESALRAGRPRVVFSGDIVETPQTLYGADYQWGDLVQGVGFGETFACRVDRVHVRVEGGSERVEASIRSEP